MTMTPEPTANDSILKQQAHTRTELTQSYQLVEACMQSGNWEVLQMAALSLSQYAKQMSLHEQQLANPSL